MHHRAALLALSTIACFAGQAYGATSYKVVVHTDGMVGRTVRLALDLVSDNPARDSVSVVNFAHNGRVGPFFSAGTSLFSGGPVWGDLLDGLNPAPLTWLDNGEFFNECLVPFDSIGTTVTFGLSLPEQSPDTGTHANQVAMYLLAADRTPLFNTADPLGANACFALNENGASGGDLAVYWPATFVAPDSIVINLALLPVPVSSLPLERLVFSVIKPNPSLGATTRASCVIPAPGGRVRLRVYDVLGRLVKELGRETEKAGTWTAIWNNADEHGNRVAPGVYLLELRLGGQSVVRRVVLAR